MADSSNDPVKVGVDEVDQWFDELTDEEYERIAPAIDPLSDSFEIPSPDEFARREAEAGVASEPPHRTAAAGPRRWYEVRAQSQQTLMWVMMTCLVVGGLCWVDEYRRRGIIDIDYAEARTAKYEIDLNSARWPEFSAIPGIGKITAQRIVDFRETHGPYGSLQSITAISGIGQSHVKKLTPYVKEEYLPEAETAAREPLSETE